MKKNNFSLTDAEYEIMTVLWREGRPLSKTDILDLSINQSWKSSSTHALLRSLLSKGAIKIHSYSTVKNNKFRLYCPVVSKEEYGIMHLNSQNLVDKHSLPYLVSSLITDSGDDDLIQELQKIIDEKRGRK